MLTDQRTSDRSHSVKRSTMESRRPAEDVRESDFENEDLGRN